MLTKLMKQQFKFVKSPNLPTGDVVAVAISEDANKAEETLKKLDIEVIKIKKTSKLPTPVCSHADLQLLHLCENRLLNTNEHLCVGELQEFFSVEKIGAELGNIYPKDVILNCKIVGNNIFLNRKTIAHEIMEFAEINGLNVINVKQGYTGCSICAVNESAIITDDESVFAAAQNFLNDVLFISKGSIRLKGYGYGFIGGCCGKISNNKLAVNGRIESHTDYKKITDFLSVHKVSIVELSDEPLTDIGGILPLLEKN